MKRNGIRIVVAALLLTSFSQSAFAEKLTIALPTNINTLDPHNSTTVPTDLSLASHIYTPLIDRGPDGKLRPGAAESWETVDDNTWRFHLRDDITFSDGEKLDAEAVKWSMERILNPDSNLRMLTWFKLIDDIKVIDPLTLEFQTSAPYPALADQLSMFFIVPPVWAANHDLATETLGSGPYVLEKFTSGDSALLSERENYWGVKPDFDKVELRVMPEDSSRLAALLSEDADFITAYPPSDVEKLGGREGITTGAVPSTRFMFIKLNILKEPLENQPEIWRALNHAVNKELILGALWNGMGEVATCQPLSSAYFGYNAELEPYDYDPEKAKQLLSDAGYANGLQLELEVPLGRYVQATDIAQVVAAQLAEVGVTVSIKEMEFGAWLNKYRVENNLGDMAYMGLAWPTLDADGLLSFWESTNNMAYYNNPDFDALLREARTTVDPGHRKELYAKATQILCDAPPYISMFFQPITYANGPRVEWIARGDDWVRAMDMHSK